MSSSRLAQSVNDARITFQRLSDAKIVHGWVITFDGDWLNARLSDELAKGLDNRFTCRIYGEGSDFTFAATLQSGADSIYHFRMEGDFEVVEPTGDARFARDVPAVVNGIPVQITDVSSQGIGFISLLSLRSGDLVSIEIEGTVVTGHVRFCRARRTAAGGHRVGVQIDELGRIDRVRWKGIVHASPEMGPPPRNRLAA